MKKIIYIILILFLMAVVFFVIKKNNEEIKIEKIDNPKTNLETEYVSFKNREYGLEFNYPRSWGEVIVKEGNKICPDEDSYSTIDTLHIFDKELYFNEIKLPESQSFINTGIRTYLLDPNNLNPCGDDFHLSIAKKEIVPEMISSFRLNSINLKNGLSGTFNNEASRLDTTARTQYTFFVSVNSKIYIIQPYMSFIPYYESPELKEMEEIFGGDMGEYLEKGVTSEKIRKYFEEFSKMAESMNYMVSFKEETSSILGCYVARINKDVYTLHIQKENGGNVSGTLDFDNFQKDSSSGFFSGIYNDGILLGDYSFSSEGMDSVMQVIFKKSGDNFVRGYGEVNKEGTKFIDLKKIDYDESSLLSLFKKESCVENIN